MKITRLIFILAAIAWLFIVTFSYYIVHKPFTTDTLLRLGDNLNNVISLKPSGWNNVLALADAIANVILVFVFFLCAAGVGRNITRRFDFVSSLESVSLHTGLGLGLFSFATIGLGLVGLLNPIFFWILFLLVGILFRNDLLATLRELCTIQLPVSSRFERALATFIATSLIIAALFALTPPIGWDSQTYHLVEAQHAIEQGRIAPPPDIVYFSFPSLGEMLFLATMILRGDIAAQMVHFGYFLLILGAVFAFATRFSNSRIGWLACAILIGAPSLLLVATSAYVDAMLVFYAFAAFYALMVAFEKRDTHWYALAGAFAGMATGVKYTGIFIPIAIFVLILFRNRLHSLRSTISYLLCALAFASPWYIRNLFFTGNPVYPFVFGGPYWDVFRTEWFSRFGTGLVTTPLRIITAPWDATVFGLEGTEVYSATIGPLLLALLPLLLLLISPKRINDKDHSTSNINFELRFLFYSLIFSTVLYLFWLYGIAQSKLLIQTRLLYPAFPTFAIVAAIAFDRLHEFDLAQFSLQRFARMLTALILALTLLNYSLAFVANNPLTFITGSITRETFLEGTLGDYYRAAKLINTELPLDAKVVTLWEPRSYYIHRAIQPDVVLDLFEHRLSQTRDIDAIVSGWRNERYTHVLLYRKGLNQLFTSQYDPVSLNDVQTLRTLLARHGRLIYGEPLEVDGSGIANVESAPYAIYALESK